MGEAHVSQQVIKAQKLQFIYYRQMLRLAQQMVWWLWFRGYFWLKRKRSYSVKSNWTQDFLVRCQYPGNSKICFCVKKFQESVIMGRAGRGSWDMLTHSFLLPGGKDTEVEKNRGRGTILPHIAWVHQMHSKTWSALSKRFYSWCTNTEHEDDWFVSLRRPKFEIYLEKDIGENYKSAIIEKILNKRPKTDLLLHIGCYSLEGILKVLSGRVRP